jgi:hypothetical protein
MRNHAALRLFLGEAPFVIPAGGTALVTVHVTKNKHALRALIRRRQPATIIVTTTAYDDTGQTAATITSAALREQHRRSS